MKIPLKSTDLLLALLVGFVGFLTGREIIPPFQTPGVSAQVERGVRNVSYRPAPLIKKAVSSSRPDLWELNEMVAGLLKGEYPDDWEKAYFRIQELTFNGDGGLEALTVFFSKWGEADFPAAFKAAGNLMDGSTLLFGAELLIQLAERDPQKALIFYENNQKILRESMLIYPLVVEIARKRALNDPEGILNWGLSIEDPSVSSAIIYSLMDVMGYQSSVMKSYMDVISRSGSKALANILSQWAVHDPDSACDWWEKNNKINDAVATKALLEGIAKKDMNNALTVFKELPEELQWRYAEIIADTMDDETALTWILKTVPSTEISKTSLRRLRTWSQEDPQKAAAWILNLPDPAVKDVALILYADYAPASLPYEEIAKVLHNVQAPKARESIRKIIRERWQKKIP